MLRLNVVYLLWLPSLGFFSYSFSIWEVARIFLSLQWRGLLLHAFGQAATREGGCLEPVMKSHGARVFFRDTERMVGGEDHSLVPFFLFSLFFFFILLEYSFLFSFYWSIVD